MKLWLLSKPGEIDYDEYDSCIVAAFSEQQARDIAPTGVVWGQDNWPEYSWCARPHDVECVEIGLASPTIKYGQVICASFNAG